LAKTKKTGFFSRVTSFIKNIFTRKPKKEITEKEEQVKIPKENKTKPNIIQEKKAQILTPTEVTKEKELKKVKEIAEQLNKETKPQPKENISIENEAIIAGGGQIPKRSEEKTQKIITEAEKQEKINEKVFEQLKKRPSITQLQQMLKDEGINSSLTVYEKGKTIGQDYTRSVYYDLLKGKSITEDNQLFNAIIQNAPKVLQGRIHAKIFLYSDQQLAAAVEVTNILPESEFDLGNFWDGKNIESTFNQQIRNFKNYLEKRGLQPTGAFTLLNPFDANGIGKIINHITIQYTFA